MPGSIKREIPTQGQRDVDTFQLKMFTDPSGAGSSGPLSCEVKASLGTPKTAWLSPLRASTQNDSGATGALLTPLDSLEGLGGREEGPCS